MKKVCQRKNNFGHTRIVYTASARERRSGASLGFCVDVVARTGEKHRTGYFNSVDEALQTTWNTDVKRKA